MLLRCVLSVFMEMNNSSAISRVVMRVSRQRRTTCSRSLRTVTVACPRERSELRACAVDLGQELVGVGVCGRADQVVGEELLRRSGRSRSSVRTNASEHCASAIARSRSGRRIGAQRRRDPHFDQRALEIDAPGDRAWPDPTEAVAGRIRFIGQARRRRASTSARRGLSGKAATSCFARARSPSRSAKSASRAFARCPSDEWAARREHVAGALDRRRRVLPITARVPIPGRDRAVRAGRAAAGLTHRDAARPRTHARHPRARCARVPGERA